MIITFFIMKYIKGFGNLGEGWWSVLHQDKAKVGRIERGLVYNSVDCTTYQIRIKAANGPLFNYDHVPYQMA